MSCDYSRPSIFATISIRDGDVPIARIENPRSASQVAAPATYRRSPPSIADVAGSIQPAFRRMVTRVPNDPFGWDSLTCLTDKGFGTATGQADRRPSRGRALSSLPEVASAPRASPQVSEDGNVALLLGRNTLLLDTDDNPVRAVHCGRASCACVRQLPPSPRVCRSPSPRGEPMVTRAPAD